MRRCTAAAGKDSDRGDSRPFTLPVPAVLIMCLMCIMLLQISGSDTVNAQDQITVSTEQELRDAVNAASDTEILISSDIELAKTLTVPKGRHIVFRGVTGNESLYASTSARWLLDQENLAVLAVKGSIDAEGITFDGSGKIRTMFIDDTGSVTLGDGAAVRGGTLGQQQQNVDEYGAGIQVGTERYGTAAKHASLTLNEGSLVTDCRAAGSRRAIGLGVGIGKYGQVEIDGGVIENCTDGFTGENLQGFQRYSYGGGVGMKTSSGTLIMRSGAIRNNTAFHSGAGVYLPETTDRFIMTGGTISGNEGRREGSGVYNGGTFEMSGGSITQNVTHESASVMDGSLGGGVFNAQKAYMELSGGEITDNVAETKHKNDQLFFVTGQGGGIFTAGTVRMSGGIISGNQAKRTGSADENAGNGGGVAVAGGPMAEETNPQSTGSCGTFLMTGGTISSNSADHLGGGVYVNDIDTYKGWADNEIRYTSGSGEFAVSGSPVITGNTASDGSNVFISKDTYITVAGKLGPDADIMAGTDGMKDGTVIAVPADDYRILYADTEKFSDDQGSRCFGLSHSGQIVKGGSIGNVSIADAVISGITDAEYTGEEITQEGISVVLDETELKRDRDYILTYQNNINSGTASVIINGYGDYTGEKTAEFNITKKALSDAMIDPIRDRIYRDGEAIEPALTVRNGNVILTPEDDYSVSYSNNTEIGEAGAVITAADGSNYTGTASAPFNIVSADGKNIITSEDDLAAFLQSCESSSPQTAYIKGQITLTKQVIVPASAEAELTGDGDDAELKLSASVFQNISSGAEEDYSGLTVKGTLRLENVNINAAQKGRAAGISSGGILYLEPDAVIENGKNTSESSHLDGQGIYVAEGASAVIEGGIIKNNAKSGADRGNGGGIFNKGTLTVSAGTFTGNSSTRGGGIYNSGGLLITGGTFTSNNAYGSVNNDRTGEGRGGAVCNAQTGNSQISGAVMRSNYSSDSGGAVSNEGTMTLSNVEITGNKTVMSGAGIDSKGETTFESGLVSGNTASNWTISRISGSGGGVSVSAGSFTMNGGNIAGNTAKNIYSYKEFATSIGNGGGVYVSNDPDDPCVFTMNGGSIKGNRAICYSPSKECGHGGGLFVMGGSGTYKSDDGVTYKGYPGEAILNGGEILENTSTSTGGGVYINNREYGLSQQTFVKPYEIYLDGEAKLGISGSVRIADNSSDNLYLTKGTYADLAGQLTDESEIYLTMEKGADAVVVKGTTACMPGEKELAAIHNESGTRTVQLDERGRNIILKAAELEDTAELALSRTKFVYTGKLQHPEVNVILKDTQEALTEGKDFTVEYPTRSIDADEYTVYIYGDGDYTGTLSADYAITPKSFSKVKITAADRTYTGSAIKAVPSSVKDGKTVLLRGEDYKISTSTYKNNKNPGKASVTLQGTGNYTGKATMYFRIIPGKVSIKSAASKKAGTLLVKWAKHPGVDGYQILVATDKKFKKNKKTLTVRKGSSKSASVKKLKKKTNYYVKIRAYKKIDGKTCYGAYSKVLKKKTK